MALTTRYLGLTLNNPLIASASSTSSRLDDIRRLEDAGAGAIVLPSVFQEQIEAEADEVSSRVDAYAESSPEAQSYFSSAIAYPYGMGPESYLNLRRRARGGRHSRHRQPERIVTRRLDGFRSADRAGRRVGAGTEHVSCPNGSARVRPSDRSPI